MKYQRFEGRENLNVLYAELRVNIIRVNNAFCSDKFGENEEYYVQYCLDLFAMFESPTVDINSIILLAVQMEGIAESLEDEPEDEHYKALLKLSGELEFEMAKLP